jgi:hypothetical protein
MSFIKTFIYRYICEFVLIFAHSCIILCSEISCPVVAPFEHLVRLMRKTLTVKAIESLPAAEGGKRYDVLDAVVPDLASG